MTKTARGKAPKIPPVSMSGWRRAILIIYIVLLFVAALYCLYAVWPADAAQEVNAKNVGRAVEAADSAGAGSGAVTSAQQYREIVLIRWHFNTGIELRLLLIVIFAGLLGSCVHVATSFTSFSGNRTLVASWFWWYILRPLIGMAVALLLYFVVRGGLLMVGAENAKLDPYGIAGIAGLSGMFSKQAADKLRELFDNLFRTAEGAGDDERKDKLEEIVQVADAMIPVESIVAIKMEKGASPAAITLKRLYEKFSDRVTRLPVFDSEGVVQCIVHQGTLHKFISDRCCEAGRDQAKKPFDLEATTLEEMLAEPKIRAMTVDSLAFVPAEATVAEAKALMDKTEHCQDIFVTKGGRPDEPVIGWLTNVDIERSLEK